MEKEPILEHAADVVLKIAALIGVSAAILSIGYNHYLCTQGTWQIAFSIPVYILALFIFGIAVGMTDKTFGSFRDMNVWTGPLRQRAQRFILFLIGWACEVSLLAVAARAFLAAGQVPNCM